ncbi:cytochrome c3 family protein [Engelhardtia mirabilis]|uniref:Doubled CXXCH motif (Paired_CXXCH_1) n=1 Tax=Engelhardtia mirabilis TaxID=2528011 RepID=A0A518BQE6_9BACT|nr:Doubled CXXCH motif (Paired_CXXCH_1) [Planctomycetes bacterium Pla133]QDV03515.1 Doubled CXXCH motif (Paired_CXXCH_1) [Planctomycetes bacterium Pla86]
MSGRELLMEPARARLLAVGASVATAVVVLGIMGSPPGKVLVLPGPLSSNHAALGEDCGVCHAASPVAVAGPLHGVVSDDLRTEQSAKCLLCHSNLGDRPLAAHGGAVQLDPSTGAARGPFSVPFDAGGSLACASCHREHQGRSRSLTELGNSQCQTCHTDEFRGFGQGHPEFGELPDPSHRAILFDHRSHFVEHFAGAAAEAAPASCTDCHEPDARGGHIGVISYSVACAACHDDELRGAAQVEGSGLSLFSLPALDLVTLEDEGLDVGRWAADSAEVETAMTSFLTALAPELSPPADVDLLDLYGATESQLEAVGQWAAGIRSYYRDLSEQGQRSLVRAASRLVDRELTDDEASALAGGLPAEVLRGALDAWLPSESSVAVSAATVDGDVGREGWVEGGGWYRQDLDFTLRYRPVGHADPFIRAWSDLVGEAQGEGRSDGLGELATLLRDPKAPGQCARCHARVQEPSGGWALRWTRLEATPGLTHFSHATHFPLLDETGCHVCHQPAGIGSQGPGVASASSFAPLTREACASCHSSGGASDRCLTCHDYHVHPSPAVSRPSPLLIERQDAALDESPR